MSCSNSEPRRGLCPRLTRRRGVGLIEMMIALSISASVLVAVAAAVNASFEAYSVNEVQSDQMQRARIAMNHILTNLRTTTAHQPITASVVTNFKAGQTVTDTGVTFIDDSGNVLTYKFDAPNKQVVAVTGAGTTYTMVHGVSAFSVKFEPMQSPMALKTGGGFDAMMRATLQMTLNTWDHLADSNAAAANQTMTLSASVMPRKNAW